MPTGRQRYTPAVYLTWREESGRITSVGCGIANGERTDQRRRITGMHVTAYGNRINTIVRITTSSASIMKRINVNVGTIADWASFHDVFAQAFGFPSFYGRNMDAWNDCMTCLDDPDSGMSAVTCAKCEVVLLELENVRAFRSRCPEQYNALVECSAFLNWRRIEKGDAPLLMLSYYR